MLCWEFYTICQDNIKFSWDSTEQKWKSNLFCWVSTELQFHISLFRTKCWAQMIKLEHVFETPTTNPCLEGLWIGFHTIARLISSLVMQCSFVPFSSVDYWSNCHFFLLASSFWVLADNRGVATKETEQQCVNMANGWILQSCCAMPHIKSDTTAISHATCKKNESSQEGDIHLF